MGLDQIHLINPYQPCSDRPLYENSGPLGLPPLLQVGDVGFLLPPLMHEVTQWLSIMAAICDDSRNLLFLCYLVISRDDDLRVAESRYLLARGEAAVRLLDERGQVVDTCSPQLFQDLDLEKLLLTLIFVGNLQKCSRYVSSQPVAKFRFVLSSGSLRYSMHVKPIFVLVETSKVTWERELLLYKKQSLESGPTGGGAIWKARC